MHADSIIHVATSFIAGVILFYWYSREWNLTTSILYHILAYTPLFTANVLHYSFGIHFI